MISKRIGGLCAALGLALASSACVDDYGYGGMSVGYGNGGYYGAPYDDGYGYGGNGSSYYGWYGDYYYPGAGIYVYDQYRRPYRWNDTQRRYWSNQQRYRGRDWNGGGSWNGFDRRTTRPGYDGNRQLRGNDGDRQGQRRRDGYTPGYQGTTGTRGGDGRTFTPQSPRDSGRWQSRGADRSGGQWQGRRGGGDGSASRRGANTQRQRTD